MVLMTLLPPRLLPKVRPVAAEDYFLKNRLLSWFSLRIIGILPIVRGGKSGDPLAIVHEALARGEIVILFPEGSRGEPERLSEFKSGVAHLARAHPEVPVIPAFLHGLGKSLPKGSAVFVPFCCDVVVGEPIPWQEDRKLYMQDLRERMSALAGEIELSAWECVWICLRRAPRPPRIAARRSPGSSGSPIPRHGRPARRGAARGRRR